VAGPLDTGPKGTALEDKILEMAWNVAISLDGGSDADEADVDDLHTAVDFVYGAGTRTYDGV
jgi:hypothetical protein